MQIIKNIKPKITIIDYQLSNLFSINNALLHLGFNSLISNDLNDKGSINLTRRVKHAKKLYYY